MPSRSAATATRRRRPIALLAVASLVAGLAPALAQDPAPAAPSAAKPAAVPFELVASNHMVVSARINGKGPYRLVFDLGAPITLLGNRAGEESGAIAKDAPKSFLMAMRGEGKIATLEVGELAAKDLPVVVLDHPTLKALGGFLGRPLDGIIGFTFFARYRTTIDYQAKMMTLTPVDYEVRDLIKDLPGRLAGPRVARRRVLAPTGLWGLTLGEPAGAGLGVAIRTVRPGSPAEAAGLKPGDVLTSIDGRWTTDAADTYAAVATAAPGQAVEAVVLRDGREIRVRVEPIAGI